MSSSAPGQLCPDPSPGLPPQRKCRSKIARLPRELRALVNDLLADGANAHEVVQKLGEHGVFLNTQNVYDWFHGPHQLWLAEQRALEECRLRHELTVDFVRENPGTATVQGAQAISAALIAEAVARFGPETLRTALQSDPMNLFRALQTLALLADSDARYQQLDAAAAHRQLKLQLLDQSTCRKKPVTSKTIDELKTELNLL